MGLHFYNFSLLTALRRAGGLYVLASVVEGEFTDEALAERQNHIKAWHRIVSEMRLKALPVTTVAPTLTEGVRHAVLLSGLGPVRPNLAVIPFISDAAGITPRNFISLLRVGLGQRGSKHLVSSILF